MHGKGNTHKLDKNGRWHGFCKNKMAMNIHQLPSKRMPHRASGRRFAQAKLVFSRRTAGKSNQHQHQNWGWWLDGWSDVKLHGVSKTNVQQADGIKPWWTVNSCWTYLLWDISTNICEIIWRGRCPVTASLGLGAFAMPHDMSTESIAHWLEG